MIWWKITFLKKIADTSFRFVKKTSMPANPARNLGYVKCYSSSNPRPIKSPSNSRWSTILLFTSFSKTLLTKEKTNRAVVLSCRPFPNIPKYMDHWWTHFSIISVIFLVHFFMLQLLSSPIPSFILITFPRDSRESKFMSMFLLNLAFKFPFGSASKTIPWQFWMWFFAFSSMYLESNHFMSAKKNADAKVV